MREDWTREAAILELAAVVAECPPEHRQRARAALEWICEYSCGVTVEELAEPYREPQ